jgi:hypothetical protein
MRKVFQVSLIIAAVFIVAVFLTSPAMAAGTGLLTDNASVSKGFSAAATYVQIAAVATTLINPISGGDPNVDSNCTVWPCDPCNLDTAFPNQGSNPMGTSCP